MKAKSMHDRLERLGLTGFRMAVAAVLFGLTAPQVFIVCMAAGLGAIPGGLISLIACGCVVVLAVLAIPAHLPSGYRFLFVVWCALSLVAVYQLGMMSVFMLDAEKEEYAANPTVRQVPSLSKQWLVKHSCLTAYVVGGYLAGQKIENIYDPSHYRNTMTPTPVHDRVGDTHKIDEYVYPPPFLILPRLLFVASDDFFQIRTYWFALNVLVAVLALGAIAVWIGGRGFGAHWLALPMMLAAPSLHATFQIGNAHFFVICLAMLGMLAFEKGRDWIGGLALGFAIVSKLFPGVLLVYLLFRRQWGAVLWTGAAIIGLCLVTLLLYGDRPFHAFVDFQLPRLASSDELSLRQKATRVLLNNLSSMGAIYKLDRLDLLMQFDPAQIADAVKKVFAVVLVAVTAFAGYRQARSPCLPGYGQADEYERLTLARTWLALIVLGQMLSPFLPWVYGGLAIVWLIALFAASTERPILRGLLVTLGWLLFAFPVPLLIGSQSILPDLAVTLLAFLAAAILCIYVAIWEKPTRHAPATLDAKR